MVLQLSLKYKVHTMSRDYFVGIVIDYGLDKRSSIPDSVRNFSPLHSVKTDSKVHTASYPMCKAGYFRGSKAAGA
jgi:hypothetical protein